MSLSAELSPTPFGRLLTAMVTPFDAEGRVDLALAGRLARHLVEEGSEGLVVCGTTGESPTLSWQEQVKMLEVVRQAVGPGQAGGTRTSSQDGQRNEAFHSYW